MTSDCGVMTPLEEVSLYHDKSRFGYFALMLNKSYHRSYRLNELESALENIPGDAEAFISQGEFKTFRRRSSNVSNLGLAFSDLDGDSVRGSSPEKQARALLLHCDDNKLPRPSIINYSGRGLHAKWIFDTPIPGQAISRWNRAQEYLQKQLEPFGPDPAARDAARLLRVIGTKNIKTDQIARTIWPERREGIARWDFDIFCDEVLPFTRQQVCEMRQKAAAWKLARQKSSGTVANLWSPRQLWWHRMADLRRLVELRGWTAGVPEGQRVNFLLIAVLAMLWSGEIENIEAQILSVASEFCPSLPPREALVSTKTVVNVAVTQGPLRYSSGRIVEILEITPEEQKHMRTLIDTSERKERSKVRHKIYDEQRQWGSVDRQTYIAQARDRAEPVIRLRQQGCKLREIADKTGLTLSQIKEILHRSSM